MTGPVVALRVAVRTLRTLSLLAGLGILSVLIVRVGKDATLAALARGLGWQFLLICLPYGLVMTVDTLGWRYAFAFDRVPFPRLLVARIAGEALNAITAVAPVGGDAVKVWLLRSHVPYRESVASVIIAKTTIILAQSTFSLVGVVLAVILAVDSRLVLAMLGMLALEVVGVGGFFAAQWFGFVTYGGRLLYRFGVLSSIESAEGLDSELQNFYRRHPRRLCLSVAFHLLGWFLGVIETILILRALQVSASLPAATLIETVGSAVRFATFFVPGSVGALEGANTGAFAALGLGASAGLAFSLVRRCRQIVWIAIGLITLAVARATSLSAKARAA
jgi:glycosyltransferase 2 family protein